MQQKLFVNENDFKPVKKKIGKGCYGVVNLVEHNIYPSLKFALKIMKKQPIEQIYYIKKEIKIHQKLYHPNIIRLEGIIETKDYFYLYMEYAENKDLFTFMKTYVFNDILRLRIFKQISLAVQYMHNQNLVHRDIKPENILLNRYLDAKLCDFGWSTKIKEESKNKSFCGTLEYMAPEIQQEQFQTKAVDIWSLGVLLYELFHDEIPFKEGMKSKKLIFKDNLDSQIKQVILNCLKKDPKLRPNISEILKHNFLNGKNLLEKQKTEFKGYSEQDIFNKVNTQTQIRNQCLQDTKKSNLNQISDLDISFDTLTKFKMNIKNNKFHYQLSEEDNKEFMKQMIFEDLTDSSDSDEYD